MGLSKKNERIDDDGLFEGQPLCLDTLNRPSLIVSCMPTFTLPVPSSSVLGQSQSIISSAVSSSFHHLNPIRSGKQLFFLVQLYPLVLWSPPPMHHGKGVSQTYLLFCFVYILINVLTFMFLI